MTTHAMGWAQADRAMTARRIADRPAGAASANAANAGTARHLRMPLPLRLPQVLMPRAGGAAAAAMPGFSVAWPAARPLAAAQPALAAVHANNFGALRLAAALLVVYGHTTADQTGTFGLRLLMFFAISGFLVAGSWHADPHPGRFLQRRLLRLWPAYAAVIVTCAGLSWLFPAPDMPDISRMASLFYLRNLWFSWFDWGFFHAANPFMNQSLWMVRYEVDLYLAFAAVALLGRRWLAPIAALVLLTSIGSAQPHGEPGGLLDSWSLCFAGYFAFGVLLREWRWLREGVPVAACVLLGVALIWAGERTAGLLLVIPAGAVWVGERSWPLLRSAGRFGDLSLGIFLWAAPVQQVTRLWVGSGTPAALQLAIVLAQVLPLAWLSWRLIEAPALQRKPARPPAAQRSPVLQTAG